MIVPDPDWKHGPEDDEDYNEECDNTWDYDPGPDCEPDPMDIAEREWNALWHYEREFDR
jgi:hypothetical protein